MSMICVPQRGLQVAERAAAAVGDAHLGDAFVRDRVVGLDVLLADDAG
jgi:hypothetical protein